jgi:hypothetical protein
MLERTQREDGSWELRRPKLDADNRKHYTVSQRTIDDLKNQRTSYQDAKEAHDGYLADWTERGRFQRDGKQWVIVQEGFFEYAVELEITANGGIGEVIPLRPSERTSSRKPPILRT